MISIHPNKRTVGNSIKAIAYSLFLMPLMFSCTTGTEIPVPLENVSLRSVRPEGWLHTMLTNQRGHLTGYLDTIAYPFTHGGWGTEPFYYMKNGERKVTWEPYEQTAYYLDGVLRCGYLLDDEFLIGKGTRAIYGSIETASPEGVIASELHGEKGSRWPHSIFFRAWMAEYEATGNPIIPERMERHYLNDTVRYRWRDLCNAEALAWLYRKTGNERLLDRIVSLYEALVPENSGDYASGEKQEIHGVTYLEMLKVPLMYYMVTGDGAGLRTARNGFDKIDRWHMLPDGVNSSEEGLSGNGSTNTHETCDIVDYSWTCTYMLKLTRETQWADRIERAVFNAGLGAITKDFSAHQYQSCPNQVFCDDRSSLVAAYDGSRMAYRQFHKPPCCTGNVNRMFPIYIGSQWMTDGDALYKTLYGPGSVTHRTAGGEIVLREESVYPYTDTVTLHVVSGHGRFPLYVRIPGWCHTPAVAVNGTRMQGVESGTFFRIDREFAPGDRITLSLPKRAEFQKWNGYDAMVVNYGPLLFALNVETETERKRYSLEAPYDKPFFGYRMNPISAWNYFLCVDGTDNSLIRVVKTKITQPENPWTESPQPLRLKVPLAPDYSWRTAYYRDGKEYVPVTPALPTRGAMMFSTRRIRPEGIDLVPYGSTQLRISMFPYWKKKNIDPGALAAE